MTKQTNVFFSENFLISVAGHLVLVAALVMSIAAVAKKIQTVAPDHVQITEIDLSAVTVTMDKTTLRNITAPAPTKPADTEKPVSKPETKPIEIDKPTLADIPMGDDVPRPAKPTTSPKPAADPVPVPVPPEKTTVRVSRDTLARTMSISAIDAFRTAMTRCWVMDQTRDDLADLRIVAHITMFDNGMVRDMWVEEASRAETDTGFAYALETINTAITVCQPFSMLPRGEFAEWEEIELTFYPATMRVY